MKARLFARILRTLVVAILLLGPALFFAAPTAIAMPAELGKTTMSAKSGHAASLGCAGCPEQSKGKSMAAQNCDATCPSPVVLPVQQAAPEPQAVLVWLILSTLDRPTFASRIEPPPPKSIWRI